MSLSPFIQSYDHVLLDLDGCVWIGEKPTPGAVAAVDALREAGKGIAFVTNNAMHPGEDFVRRLWRLGFRASLEEVVTVGGAIQHVLAERPGWRKAFVIGAEALHRHVDHAGVRVMNGTDLADRVDVVVLAGHPRFDYDELLTATLAVARGAQIICSDRDASYPMADGPHPGSGAILAALETATGATAEVVGKPSPQLFHTALDRLGPGRALVIGDRLDSDIAGAQAAGLDCALVLSGATSAAQAAAWSPPPTRVGESLADIVLRAGA